MLKNLKHLRLSNKLSQQQLADVIGVSQQSVNKYENHSVEPDVETMIKIADCFSVSVDYLVGRTYENSVTKNSTMYYLSDEEKLVIDGYRNATKKEKDIIKYVLNLSIK